MVSVKKTRYTEDYVVMFLDKRGKKRNCVVPVEIDTTQMPEVYSYYLAGLVGMETKAKPGEVIVRVSRKGYS